MIDEKAFWDLGSVFVMKKSLLYF